MRKLNREDIYIITRNSNLPEQEVQNLLLKNEYHNKEDWQQFLKIVFITLGIGFLVSGIVFFFAYNWAYLNKFLKFGLIEGLLIISTALVLFLKIKIEYRKIILTGAAVLVGVLFAVFGQVYQTGANAYDFFLAWTLCIMLWVIVADYAPLWLLFLILINTTLILYSVQVARYLSNTDICALLVLINSLVLISAHWFTDKKKTENLPNWFVTIFSIAIATYATAGIVFGIFNDAPIIFWLLLIFTSCLYTLGIQYSLRKKSLLYLSIISFSLIVIISAIFFRLSYDMGMFLFVCIFILGSVTMVIKNLLDLQKKWADEK